MLVVVVVVSLIVYQFLVIVIIVVSYRLSLSLLHRSPCYMDSSYHSAFYPHWLYSIFLVCLTYLISFYLMVVYPIYI